jgi:3-dehydroquinate synthase
MEVCFQVWQALSDYEIGRKDLIINLGGGVVTDMGGFIAAVFKRGLDFIHVPTTLVGMVDAAIGGKTGIDLGPYKNQIGVFKQPVLVLIDTIFLSTLNDSERLNGYAEMLKHALIFDRELWDLLTVSHLNKVCNRKFIERSAKIKMSIVEKDPFEKDLRKVLNYGHTIGHALEGYFLELNEFLPHGQAVGIGMIAETYLSHKKGLLSEMAMKNILSHLSAVFHVPEFSKNAIPQILKLCRNDKKNESTKINFTLLCEIGNAKVNQHVSEADVAEALLFLGSLSDLKFTFSQD